MVALGSLGLVIAIGAYARAQIQSEVAVCTNSSYQWTFNSLGQSPCLVTSLLGSVCTGGTFNVPTLAQGNVYEGPIAGSNNPCLCSSVVYSCLSACSLCQSESYLSWSIYKTNCSTVYQGVFPFGIPVNTTVPAWAFLNVSTNGFVPAVAKSDTAAPESTYSGTSTSTGSASTTSPSASSTSRTSNTGSIVGGTVGGVVGLALIAALVFWWRRRLSSRPTSTMPHPNLNPVAESVKEPLMFNPAPAHFTNAPSMRIYDPSDPSTFPPSSPAPSGNTTGESAVYSNAAFSTQTTQTHISPNTGTRTMRYTGVAEPQI